MANKVKRNANMRVTKKDVPDAEFDDNNRQTVASMKYGRINVDYLTSLILAHKDDYAKDPDNCTVSDELASIIRIVILKTLGLPSWREYSKDWKEEFFFRAEYVALKYIHNFSPAKMASDSKNNDPYYYIGTIVSRAFQQKLIELQKKSAYIKFTSLNENILHSCTAIDQYAGVLHKEEQKVRDNARASIGVIQSIDEAVETIGRLNKEDGIEDENSSKKKKKKKKPAEKKSDVAE